MLFEPGSRVEKTDKGLRFYEQDIVFSGYVFQGNVTVDLRIDYLQPGFGIVIAENNKGEPRKSERAHLFKIGNYRFQEIEKDLLTQVQNKENSCLLAPGEDRKNQNLVFSLEGRQAKLVLKYQDTETKKEKLEELGACKLRRKPKEYFIGFYSNKGNIIRSVQFLQGAPANWVTSIKNAEGGRISFVEDGFQFENCAHDAELEQDRVELEAGTYHVSYDKELVNGLFDIDCFVFPSQMIETMQEIEDRFVAKSGDGQHAFMLSHRPSGEIHVFVDGNECGKESNETAYAYHSATNTVVWQDMEFAPPAGAEVLLVYESAAPRDAEFEDPSKNLLKEDGSFTVRKKMMVNIKFQGTQGRIKNVCIKDMPESSFVETEDEPLTIEASYIRVNLDDISKILWSGTVYSTPDFTDLTKPCPYGIAETSRRHLSKEDLGIALGRPYDYEYHADGNKVISLSSGTQLASIEMPFGQEDANKITIFHNVRAAITRLILVSRDGKQVDVLNQRTYKKFVPAEIESPILVYNEDDEPFDLSASYREVVDVRYRIDYFSSEAILELKESPLDQNIEVYGIPFGTSISPMETEMDNFAKHHERISESKFELRGRALKMDDRVRVTYRGIAVRYQGTGQFHYYFTNYEREYFRDEPRLILEKQILEAPGNIIVYGCRKKPNLEQLYRVPSEQMINAIDLCVSEYDLIPGQAYKLDYTKNELILSQELRKEYPYLIVDYLKDDSYAINYRDDIAQYEVDVSMGSDIGYVGYDMNEDGKVNRYVQVPIRPDKSKFILLKRKTGMWDGR